MTISYRYNGGIYIYMWDISACGLLKVWNIDDHSVTIDDIYIYIVFQ